MSLVIEVTNVPEFVWIILMDIEAMTQNDLIATKSRGFVDSVGVKTLEAEIFLGSCNKESLENCLVVKSLVSWRQANVRPGASRRLSSSRKCSFRREHVHRYV